MIFTLLLVLVALLINQILALIPDIPQTPTQLETVKDFTINMAEGAGGFLQYIYGPFFPVVITLIIALLAFENIYWICMWVYKKIPVIGAK